jgi:nitrite reductase (NADH) large subunit
VIAGTSCQRLSGAGRVERAALADGRELPVDLVVISAGVRSRTALAAEAGLAVNRGIVVDDHLQTSAPDIYAAGDCAEWSGRVYGIVPASHDQAQVAASNMLSPGSARYRGTVVHNRLKVAGVDLLILGDAQPQGGPGEEHRHIDRERGIYRKLVTLDGRLVGAVLLGDLSRHGEIRALISSGEPVGDRLAGLVRGSEA